MAFSSTATTQTITGLTAGTAYTFTVAAQNAAGYGSASPASASVTPNADRPATPAAPTATAGALAATVTWVTPASNGSALTGYQVTPYLNGVAQTVVSYDASTTTRTVTGLTAGGSYTFTVAAVNAIGTSSQSAQSNTVFPYDVPGAPAITAATAGTQRATLTWSAPSSNGSTVTAYVITPYIGATAQTPQTFASAALTQTVTGLTAGTAYTFKVAATNAAGTGSQSAASASVTPNAAPTLTFGNPPLAQVGVAYSNQFAATGGTSPFTWSVSAGTLPAGLTLTSAGLLSGTPTAVASAAVTVRVVDASGQVATKAVTVTVADRPATPAAPTATAGLTSAVLSWTAPVANNSTISAYVITPYRDGTAQASITVDPSAKTRTLNGLTVGSVYSFTIAATNAAGTSAASASSNPVTPYAALSEPSINSVTAGSTSARLTWTAPTNTGGSAITGYVVTPYIGTTAQTPQTFASTATTQTVTGLTAGTAYTFKVAALNNSGTTVLRRINAGGPLVSAIDGGLDWAADPDNSTLHNTTNSATHNGVATSTDATVPATTPLGIYYTERWYGGAINWAIPVTAGTPIKVRLYIAETYYTGSSAGQRTFDVALDGTTVMSAFDPIVAAGGSGIGTMREFAITSDGTVNIDFARLVDNPIINGIEIIQTGTATTGPQSAASASTTPNASPTLTFADPPAAQVNVAYSQQLTVNDGTAPFTWAVSTGTLPAGISLSSGGLLSGTPTTAGTSNFTVQVTDGSGQTATRAISLLVQDRPAKVAAPTATPGTTSVTVGWVAPASNGSPITNYLITPYKGGVAQPTTTFDTSTTTRTLTGLTAGSFYTFTVIAVNGVGSSDESAKSPSVVPYDVPAAPVFTSAKAADLGATLKWNAPSTNGSAITGYVVTPYIGSTAQPTQSFDGATTTATITGLTAGTSYTFTVAAQNAAGTGPASASSTSVVPNALPTLAFPAPPAGEVGVAYSRQLAVTDGTSPFTWTVSTGTLPAGITLSTSGLLSGTPTAAGSNTFTVQVSDASGQTATRSVTLVVNAAPSIAFTPAAGEVGVAYSQQPTVSGGSAPYAWSLTAGALPAGVTLNTSTGLVSGTPTAPGSFSITLRVASSSGQAASKTVNIAIAAVPTITSSAPAAGQVGVAYSTTFTVAGGTSPYSWSTSAGSVPSGLTLNSGTGVLAGTPTTTGSFSFTVAVTDSFGKTATKAVTLVVNAGPLVITKAANVSSVVAGGAVTYTITVANTGTSTFSGITLSDPLSDVLDDAAYNADATASTGTLTYSSSTLGWTGDLAGGATVTITYSVGVNNPDVGNKVLANTVTSSTLGTNCPSGGSNPSCTATVTVAGLSIVHSAGAPSTTPGSTATFTVTVTNTGQTAYTGATFTESLAAMLDDATYNGNATATSGTLSFTSPTLSWTGNLAVGATATITYAVTVADPDVGNRSLVGTVVSPTAGSSCPSGNPAASCTATVAVLLPALSITNTAGSSTTTPGSVVPYTVTLSNTGQTAYTGTSVSVAVASAVDDASYNNNVTASAGSVVINAATATLTWTGDLAIGATVTITASFTVLDPDPGNKILTTVASSSAAGSTCPVGSSNSACTSTVQVLVPALTITKSSDVSSTTPGSVVAFTVLVTNSGQTPYTGASFSDSLTDVLDDAHYNSNVTATAGSASYSSPNVVWTGNLAIGASATITYSVTVNDPDNANRSLAGRVTSTTQGSNCASASTDNRCASTVAVLIPGLTITTAADVATTTPGSVVRLTTTVTNTGQTTYTGVPITLNSSAFFDDATSNGDGTVSRGYFGPGPSGGVNWTITLAPGETATVSGTYTVNSPATGDRTMTAVTSSDAQGSTCPTGTSNPSCTTTVTVLIPGLTITKTADRATVLTGGTVAYTILVVNSGQTAYSAASVTDSLSTVLTDAVYSNNAVASSGTVSYAAPTLSWTGALAVGATATITYSVVVRDPDPGDKRLINTAVSPDVGSNCASGSTDARCTVSVAVLVPGLTIAKTASAASTAPGATVGFTVKVTNSGTAVQTGAAISDSLAGVLDDATYNNNATATAGTVSYSAGTLSWTGDLAVGASATITYSATVNTAPGGDNRLINSASSTTRGNNCPTSSADPRCAVNVPVARLLLVRSPQETTTTPGSVVHLPVTFTNTGQVAYTGISITIPRADTSDDVFATGDDVPSSGSLVRGTVTTVWTGDIPVGGVVTIAFTRTVKNPPTGNRLIRATLVTDAAGSNCPTGGTIDPRCSMSIPVLVPGLTMTKAASATQVEPGSAVSYTITITNSGETAYPAASVTDALAGVLDDATYNGNAVASTGTVSYSSPNLSWTGGLAVGASVTITYSVTVNPASAGDKSLVNRISSDDVGSSCLTASSNAGCVSTVQVLTPALTITKTADLAQVTLGSTVTYSVLVSNTGQTAYSSAQFNDSLAGVLDDATYQAAATSATSGTLDYSGGVLGWSGALAVGASATISYAVQVNNPAAGNRSLTNTVVSTSAGSNCAAGSTDGRCTVAVAVTNSVALTFTKTASVASTVPGGLVTYTVRVANASKAAVSSVNFTDPLGGVLDDAAFNSDAVASAGTVSYSASTLSWSGTVPAESAVTVTYSVTVAARRGPGTSC